MNANLPELPTQEVEAQRNISRHVDDMHLRGAQFYFRWGTGCAGEQGRQEARDRRDADNLLEV